MSLLLLLALLAVPADTTDRPFDPYSAPLQADLTPGIDVLHVRAALLLLPEQRAIRGTASYHVSVREGHRLLLRAGAVAVQSVRVFEDSTAWRLSGDTLSINLPGDGPREAIVHVDYATQRVGYDTRDRGGWTAVWTPSHADESHWIPPPLSWSDAFTVDVRMNVPPSWEVRFPRGAHQRIPSPDVTTYVWRPDGERLAHGLGFLASAPGHLVGVDSLVWRLADEGVPVPHQPTVATILLPAGYPSQYWDGLHLLSDETILEETPVMQAFQELLLTARAELGALQTGVYLTDGWLAESMPAFLAAQALRSAQGDGAWALLMETARARYVAETETYMRPLVWDRWDAPIDLDDAHAIWKGLWVMHMLAVQTGHDAMTDAIRDVVQAAGASPVDTESFRARLEDRSGLNLGPFFDTWVYGAGHPVLTLIYAHQPDEERLTVILEQEQEGSYVPEHFPLAASLSVSSLSGIERYPVAMSSRTVRTSMDAPIRPRYVHLDDEMTVLYTWSSPPDPDDLTARLRDAQTDVARIQLLATLAGSDPDAGLLIGLRQVFESATPAVAEAALPVLAGMAPSPSALRVVQGMSDAEPGPGRARLAALSAFPGDEAAAEALRTANTRSDGFLLEAAVRILVSRRPNLSWSVLQSALVTDSDEDRIRRLAIREVARADRSARERLDALLPLTEGPNRPVTRGEALLAAARLSPTNTTVRRRTAAWLPDERPALRAAAIAALAELSNDAISDAALEGALRAETRPALRRALQRYIARR